MRANLVNESQLARIARLERALLGLGRDDVSLAGLAHDCGYSDQAHLSRDFRHLTGLTPGQWRRRDGHSFARQFASEARLARNLGVGQGA